MSWMHNSIRRGRHVLRMVVVLQEASMAEVRMMDKNHLSCVSAHEWSQDCSKWYEAGLAEGDKRSFRFGLLMGFLLAGATIAALVPGTFILSFLCDHLKVYWK